MLMLKNIIIIAVYYNNYLRFLKNKVEQSQLFLGVTMKSLTT